jgi:hypothetical protein
VAATAEGALMNTGRAASTSVETRKRLHNRKETSFVQFILSGRNEVLRVAADTFPPEVILSSVRIGPIAEFASREMLTSARRQHNGDTTMQSDFVRGIPVQMSRPVSARRSLESRRLITPGDRHSLGCIGDRITHLAVHDELEDVGAAVVAGDVKGAMG